MASQASTLAKFRVLEMLYRQGYRSDVVDRAMDKIIALERERAQRELAELQSHLHDLERRYGMSSEEFYRRYEEGDLGDEADFTEWSAFYDMMVSVQRRLDCLSGQGN